MLLSSVLVGIFNNNEERCIFFVERLHDAGCVCGVACGIYRRRFICTPVNISIRSLQLMDESSMLL
jgi:hypothetical protein